MFLCRSCLRILISRTAVMGKPSFSFSSRTFFKANWSHLWKQSLFSAFIPLTKYVYVFQNHPIFEFLKSNVIRDMCNLCISKNDLPSSSDKNKCSLLMPLAAIYPGEGTNCQKSKAFQKFLSRSGGRKEKVKLVSQKCTYCTMSHTRPQIFAYKTAKIDMYVASLQTSQ